MPIVAAQHEPAAASLGAAERYRLMGIEHYAILHRLEHAYRRDDPAPYETEIGLQACSELARRFQAMVFTEFGATWNVRAGYGP